MIPVFLFLCCLCAARSKMSDYDSDPLENFNPSGELLLEAAQSPLAQSPVQRRSARLASSQSEQHALLCQLRAHGISPAPGLQLSQLQELASFVSASDSPTADPASAEEIAAPEEPTETQRGRKRSRKTDVIRPKRRGSSSRPAAAGAPRAAAAAAAAAPHAAAAAATAAATPHAAAAVAPHPAAAAAATTVPRSAAAAAVPPAAGAASASSTSLPHDILLSSMQSLVRSVQAIG